MEKLPASFSQDGVWFADYGRAWELAGLPPRPSNVDGNLALSDKEQDAYQTARRGLIFGPNLLLAARSNAQGWEDVFGFGLLSVSIALGTGETDQTRFGTAYLESDFDEEAIGQRLLELGYHEEPVNGAAYYAIRGDRDQDLQAPTRKAGILAQMNRVFLAEGILAAGPDTEPIVAVVAAASGNTPILSDEPVFSRLAASLGNTLSAALLTRRTVLEPEGFARKLVYEMPEDWGKIHQWEVLGTGYSATEDSRWWGVSLYYPDPEAAEADAGELVARMNGYRTAITPLMYPDMSDVGLASAAEHPFFINDFCESLTPVYASDETGSILTVWCQMSEPPSNRWHTMLEMRDLGFLLP